MSHASESRSYAPLWVLIAVTLLPILGAWLYYAFYDYLPRLPGSNHGELVTPVRPVESLGLARLDGRAFGADALRGKWTLLTVGGSACDVPCQQTMYIMRQVRLATDKERSRVQRVFVLDETRQLDDFRERLADYEGMEVVTGQRSALDAFYHLLDTGGEPVTDRIFMVDPLGNYMMNYPAGMDPELILKDLKRLLKVSKIG